ncbi:MAG: substrate-binding domain-containing protein [Deltaproteobacteria bacterium]|jgi:ribose transport system substrate-binding protein|nr:substrate-binding domain-containing protein [Deltaproteobacteria bacterium]MBT4639519.1 substrate-binding domain-containing protein [Deltaproteobacteria bacterium]
MKKINRFLAVILSFAFIISALGTVNAGTFKIKAKGNKQIKIGVMDLNSAWGVAASFNAMYKKYAKARGWDIQVFNLGFKIEKSQGVMDNMISAGYDAIIVNWTAPSYYKRQLKKAYDKGIPVIIIAGDNFAPGMIANFVAWDTAMGGLTAEFLAGNIKRGSKVVAYYNSGIPAAVTRYNYAKVVFKKSKLDIVAELTPSPNKDAEVDAFEKVTNVLLADGNKQIKGIWAQSDYMGIPAARAALALNRRDVVVVTADDTPRAYDALRTMPNFMGIAGYNGNVSVMLNGIFGLFEDAFAGKPVRTNQYRGLDVYLVTKETAPPKGYYYNPGGTGYEGRAKDY